MSDASDPGPAPSMRISAAARAYVELRRRILQSEMQAGAQFLEQEVTQSLGMSRTPVREALVRLEKEGLIHIRPRHGVEVLSMSIEDVREVYEVLAAVEVKAIELQARRMPTSAEMAPLESAVVQMEAALKTEDREAWADGDARFHRSLVELCGNRRLCEIARVHWDQMQRVRDVTLHLRPPPDESTREHRALLEAIRRGDHEAARELHRSNRERGQSVVLGVLERHRLHHL
jgi:DNA-binding GntR family transcriptional regulator